MVKKVRKEKNATDIIKKISDSKGIIKEMKMIGKQMQQFHNETEEILDREVTKFGNSGHIPMPLKHVGKPVKVIVKKKKEDKKED